MREDIIRILTKSILEKGYAELSLSYISKVTNIGKSSIYHHFPGGKVEIAESILLSVEGKLSRAFADILNKVESPLDQFHMVLDILAEFYQNGRSSCLIDVMSISSLDESIKNITNSILDLLINKFQEIFLGAGLKKDLAEKKAIHVVSLIQGSLILSRVKSDPSFFNEQIKELKNIDFTQEA